MIAATLERVAGRMTAQMTAQTALKPLPLADLQAQLVGIVFADAMWPTMRLWLEIASLSARGDPLFRSVGEQLGRGFLAWGAAQLDTATPEHREADAARRLVAIEGMLVLKSIGLEDVGRLGTMPDSGRGTIARQIPDCAGKTGWEGGR